MITSPTTQPAETASPKQIGDAHWVCPACGREFRPKDSRSQSAGLTKANATKHAKACR